MGIYKSLASGIFEPNNIEFFYVKRKQHQPPFFWVAFLLILFVVGSVFYFLERTDIRGKVTESKLNVTTYVGLVPHVREWFQPLTHLTYDLNNDNGFLFNSKISVNKKACIR